MATATLCSPNAQSELGKHFCGMRQHRDQGDRCESSVPPWTHGFIPLSVWQESAKSKCSPKLMLQGRRRQAKYCTFHVLTFHPPVGGTSCSLL